MRVLRVCEGKNRPAWHRGGQEERLHVGESAARGWNAGRSKA